MPNDTYLTIKAPAKGLYKDKGSKFIALAWPVETEIEINQILAEVKKEYYDARHHCYAWAIGQGREQFRQNDDGEPSGTAGKPIYGQILSTGLTNVLVIVVRYFGGTKLGVRGLIDAYKGAAADAINNAEIITKIIYQQYKIEFDYLQMNEVMTLLKLYDLEQFDHDFDSICRLNFMVRQDLSLQVAEKFEKIEGIKIRQL